MDRRKRLVTGLGTLLLSLGMVLPLLGCNLTIPRGGAAPSPTPAPLPSPALLTEWTPLAPGIERRDMTIQFQSVNGARAVVLRLDPAQVTFRVHYSPGAAYLLNEWQQQFPGAALIVNGGFFDESDQALGLLVSDSQFFGQSFAGFGGMFQVDETGARVRSLVGEPYQGETLWQAVQGFPMLIEAGGVLAPQGEGFDQRSRRTAIGQDRAGRIVLVVIPYDIVSLAELQGWLISSDLDLAIAFGLDGGSSTGLAIQLPGAETQFPALGPVPGVIGVYLS